MIAKEYLMKLKVCLSNLKKLELKKYINLTNANLKAYIDEQNRFLSIS